jgi:uncharacterized membrane protein
MEATGDQEIFYLKHALEDETGIQVKALFYDQRGNAGSARNEIVYLDQRNGDKVYRVQHSRHGYPQTLEGLLQYDVIICSDVARSAFTDEQMNNTVRFVQEYGGGFVMIGGQTSFGAGFYDKTPLQKIIPVEMADSRDNKDGEFQVQIPAEAFGHPIMKLSVNAGESSAAWEKLPPFFGFNRVDRAKLGATVLWQHPLDRGAHGPRVLLAVQEVGKGRAMAFTTDTTAAWGKLFEQSWGNNARYYRQFWVNSARWLAANRVGTRG